MDRARQRELLALDKLDPGVLGRPSQVVARPLSWVFSSILEEPGTGAEDPPVAQGTVPRSVRAGIVVHRIYPPPALADRVHIFGVVDEGAIVASDVGVHRLRIEAQAQFLALF